MPNSKIRGLFRLFRFELPFTAGICVLLGELLALGKLPGMQEMLLGFLSVFCISATSLILNDYFDIEIDRINSPERPLPSGKVTKTEVIALSITVALLGFIAGLIISPAALFVLIIVWLVGFLYNWKFKKAGLIGNMMVCFSVGMTFIFGGIAVGKPFEILVWFFAVWVMFVDLGEEIAADAMDVEGDRAAGSRSLAVRLGREKALQVSAVIFLVVVCISFIPFISGWLSFVYLFPVLPTDIVIIYSTIKLLDARLTNRRKYIRLIYLSGMVALVIILIIRMLE
ncbi:MAG: UbiA family prenyltransferase [Ignavibacteriales bacterium]|nr:UbiA family prenyltransferase [Ignavibacteriales bacterium]